MAWRFRLEELGRLEGSIEVKRQTSISIEMSAVQWLNEPDNNKPAKNKARRKALVKRRRRATSAHYLTFVPSTTLTVT